MPPEFEIIGQPGPLPGLDLTAAQVAGQAPIAAPAPQTAPVPVAPAAPPAPVAAPPARRAAKKPELVSVDEGGRQATVRDSQGHALVIKPLTVVMRMRLIAFLGKELSGNEGYMNFAVLGCSVQSVDGEPLPMISDRNSLERAINKIGDDGIAAAAIGLVALMPKDDEPSLEDEAKN